MKDWLPGVLAVVLVGLALIAAFILPAEFTGGEAGRKSLVLLLGLVALITLLCQIQFWQEREEQRDQ